MGDLIVVFIVVVLLLGMMGIVFYASTGKTRKALGLGATMAGVLIFGAGAFLYWLVSLFGGQAIASGDDCGRDFGLGGRRVVVASSKSR